MKTSPLPVLADVPVKRDILSSDENVLDFRFQALLPPEDWARLPICVRQRFSKRLSGKKFAIYQGSVTDLRMNLAGLLLSQLLRLVGSPLPISSDVDVPSLVCVNEDAASGGQIWTRIYGRKTGFPQIINSVKRFSGPTGLEEHIGFGISIALHSSIENDALVFSSAAYLLKIMSWQFKLPRWLSPGELRVEHRDLGSGEFRFSLSLKHTVFGELLYQSGLYHDQSEID